MSFTMQVGPDQAETFEPLTAVTTCLQVALFLPLAWGPICIPSGGHTSHVAYENLSVEKYLSWLCGVDTAAVPWSAGRCGNEQCKSSGFQLFPYVYA